MNITKNIVELHITEARNRMPHNDHTVNTAMLTVLSEMALLDIYPDSSFSDDECLAWEAFWNIIREAKSQAYHDVSTGKVKFI